VSARLLVIQHEDDCPPGWLGEWLEDAGVGLTVVHGHRGEPVPASTAGYDGLLVLGGEMGAYDDVPCPWLPPTRRLVAQTVARAVPFLGVCLGHQLAAVALGGSVGKNPHGTATGLTPVLLTDAGRADALLGCVEPGQRAVQWNEDVVTALPAGSTLLAQSPDTSVQAVSFGPRAWGVQFHPEVSPEIFSSWTVNGPKADQPRPDGVDIAKAAADVAAARSELRAAWRPLAERFAALVASSATRVSTSSAAW
jgi:GMP synthase (glutamine-hydrolysing)